MTGDSHTDQLREARIALVLRKHHSNMETGGFGKQMFSEVVESLRSQGVELEAEDLAILQQKYGLGDVTAPTSFLFSCLVGSRRCAKVLNPSGNLGIIGAVVAAHYPETLVDVVSPFDEASAFLDPLALANLRVFRPEGFSGNPPAHSSFDAIISSGPIGLGRAEYTFKGVAGEIVLRDEPSNLLIAEMEHLLKPDGFMALVVNPNFLSNSGNHSVRRNLGRMGLHLSALLTLKPGSILQSSASFGVAIIDRKPRKSLFVGEVPDAFDGMVPFVERLWNRKQGKSAAIGRLVNPEDFFGLPALMARERYDKLGKRKGLAATAFSHAVPRVCAPKRSPEFERCDEYDHAVYLPEMAATNAAVNQSGLPPNLKSYLQLLVDPEIVLPEYFAGWLNTDIGQALRQSAMTGATIPRIKRSILESRKLYLPPISDQRLALQALRGIKLIRSEVSELESRLWDSPNEVSDVAASVEGVNHEDLLSDWIETFPFPLARILREYEVIAQSPKEKSERLVYFFEAFAEYRAAIHLSAARRSLVRWEAQKEKLSRIFAKQTKTVRRTDFGFWVIINQLLAADLRKMLSDPEGVLEAQEMYATATVSPLVPLASNTVTGILEKVNLFRNRWKGHGGAPTTSESMDRHDQLMAALEDLRETLGNSFSRHQLIEPGKCQVLDDSFYRYSAKRVMGSNSLLEYFDCDLMTRAKSERLYLRELGHNKALELLPIVQVETDPEQSSFYYNRLEQSGAKMISYDSAVASERESQSVALSDWIIEMEESQASFDDGVEA